MRKVVTFLAVVVFLYFLLLLHYLWTHNSDFGDKFKKQLKLHNNAKQRDNYVAILLQPSPVDTKRQLTRLETIDKGWSTWTKQSDKTIQVYASSWLTNNESSTFNNIDIVRLSTTLSPIDNMLEFFVSLLLSPSIPQYKWYVYGNDHTLFVPSNLICYLDQLDHNSISYCGNKLQRGKYQNVNLQFASGGAGVIISHTSMKLLLFAWTLSRNKYLKPHITRLLSRADDCPSPAVARFIDGEPVSIYETSDGSQFLCAIKAVIDHSSSAPLSPDHASNVQTLQVVISPRISLIVSKDIVDDVETTKVEMYDKEKKQLIQLQDKMLQSCNDYSEWAVINPGIVAAYCLQHVLHATFIDSKATDNSERLNVYGVVRSLVNEFDDWYIEAKLGLSPGYIERSKRNPEGPLQAVPNSVAFFPSKEVISFHYVSQHESNLMHQILSKRIALKSPEHLLSLWPSTDADVGHYSRKIKNINEAKLIFEYITSVVHHLHNCSIVK